MILVTVPLLVLTLGGQGYDSNGGLSGGTSVGTTLGLTKQFFILGIVLSGFGLVVRFGQRWTIYVLVAQSLILALVGERLIIVSGAVMLIYALSRMGMKLNRRHAVIGLVLLGLFAWSITAARGAEGRYSETSTASVRLTFLTTGLTNLFSSSTGHEIAYTLGYRLDGNSYGAMSLEALANGSAPVGFTPLKNDALLAIPSFLNPSKDQSNLEDRSEKLYVEENLPIPELQISAGVYQDILPTQLGGLTGILGPFGLLLAALALGLGFAALDRWLRSWNGSPTDDHFVRGALFRARLRGFVGYIHGDCPGNSAAACPNGFRTGHQTVDPAGIAGIRFHQSTDDDHLRGSRRHRTSSSTKPANNQDLPATNNYCLLRSYTIRPRPDIAHDLHPFGTVFNRDSKPPLQSRIDATAASMPRAVASIPYSIDRRCAVAPSINKGTRAATIGNGTEERVDVSRWIDPTNIGYDQIWSAADRVGHDGHRRRQPWPR